MAEEGSGRGVPAGGAGAGAAGGGGGGAGALLGGAEGAYVAELLTYSLERLGKEPALLEEEAGRARARLSEALAENSGAFLATARGLRAAGVGAGEMRGGLERLATDRAPALEAACADFEGRAAAVAARGARARQLQAHLGPVQELLEVPGLIEACVRAGAYDSALDLGAFVAKLEVLHPDLAAVRALAREAAAAREKMLEQLLGRLEEPVQLPECLRVVGFLRRTARFSEGELRLHFVTRRDRWMQAAVAGLDRSAAAASSTAQALAAGEWTQGGSGMGKGSGTGAAGAGPGGAYDFIKRLTDLHRVHMFDIVMQYRAIFSGDGGEGAAAEGGFSGGGILSDWAAVAVGRYLRVVRARLAEVSDGAQLASVLEHCMYCGMSLSRVGCDFRGLLVPAFEARAAEIFLRGVAEALAGFGQMLQAYQWASPVLGQPKKPASAAAGGESELPPLELLDHPPLAVLTNGLLAALNELRHCAALSLRSRVAGGLEAALRDAAGTLADLGESVVLEGPEQDRHTALCGAFRELMVPYLASCLGKIYAEDRVHGPSLRVDRVIAPLNQAPRAASHTTAATAAAPAPVVPAAPAAA